MVKQEYVALSGNEAMAVAFKQGRPHVASAFPITPQTEMMHKFADFVANGEVDAEMILVESEHSAMSAAIGSAAAGARTITATSSAGFALMWEVVHVAASLRLPICMALVNRALSGNINIHCDHSDAMGGRDAGWIHLFCENAQETYDNGLMAFRIGEHMDVRLPVMINYDGFIISHTADSLHIMSDADAWKFIGPYKSAYALLNVEKPITVGPLDLTDYYFEHKIGEIEAHQRAFAVVKQVSREYGELTGRHYDFFEGYRLDDAEIALVAMGSMVGTLRDAVDWLRQAGKRVGLVKIRSYRPFPTEALRDALSGVAGVAVLEKGLSMGFQGVLSADVRAALYNMPGRPAVLGMLAGYSGREMTLQTVDAAVAMTYEAVERGQVENDCVFMNLREDILPEGV